MERIINPMTQRRLRANSAIRELAAENRLSHRQFIQPLFVEEGISLARPVDGLNGVEVFPLKDVIQQVEQALDKGINKFLLFPVPKTRTTDQFQFDFAAEIIRTLKARFGSEIWIAADLCLCAYTSHGHCGILNEDQTKLINHRTVEQLTRYGLILAAAGADCIAPSDMTDGRIGSIRLALDSMGRDEVSIMSYSVKFSSQFYGPFRDACHSAPAGAGLKNRKTYQMSPAQAGDALASAMRDDREGADILMVKPAAHYTDMILRLTEHTLKPVAAYHVSGEYAALEMLAQKGWLDRSAAHLEVWNSLARAGARMIISYAATEAREWINKMEY